MSRKINISGEQATKIIWLGCLLVIGTGIALSSLYQNDFGKIDITIVSFTNGDGDLLVGKLYRPVDVTSSNPAPGVLALHGYNNDKDVQRAHSIELAKAGFVVLALDQGGHGNSDESGDNGADAGYNWLQELPFVDGNWMGLVGHSMGAGNAAFAALANPDHDALAFQSFAPNIIYSYFGGLTPDMVFNNYLHIWSSMEEFTDRIPGESATISEYYNKSLYDIGVNVHLPAGTPGEADTTYGDFAAGTAQRYEYLLSSHPGQTHNAKGVRAIVAWFLQALMGYNEADAFEVAAYSNQTYLAADFWGLVAAFGVMVSIIPLAMILLKMPMFQIVAQPMPEFNTERAHSKGWKWWVFAVVNAAIGGVTYLFFTANNWVVGEFSSFLDGAFLKEIIPAYNMGIANALSAFLLINAVIAIIIFLIWWLIAGKKKGANLDDMGITFGRKEPKEVWTILYKTAGIAIILFVYMYGITALAEWTGQIELRGPWALMKTFSIERYPKFWIYFPIILIYWVVNGGLSMYGQLRTGEADKEWKTLIFWYFKICFAFLAGLAIILAIAYLPMLWDLTGPILNELPSGPMQVLQLFGLIPIFMTLYFIAMWFFRKTGKIYLGSIICGILGTWFIVTGTVFY